MSQRFNNGNINNDFQHQQAPGVPNVLFSNGQVKPDVEVIPNMPLSGFQLVSFPQQFTMNGNNVNQMNMNQLNVMNNDSFSNMAAQLPQPQPQLAHPQPIVPHILAQHPQQRRMPSHLRNVSVQSFPSTPSSSPGIVGPDFNKKTLRQEPPVVKPRGKPLSQADKDLRVLMNNTDKFSLKGLATLIRQLEFDGGIIEKKAKLNDKKQSITKINTIDPLEKLSVKQFKTMLLCLPKSKKQQLFGTAWLKQACAIKSDGHIPRNRIFAKYVTVCADHAVPSLSPALFGKLLRLVFPFITIHRYGVRGQSKYHYCGIQLVEDNTSSASSAVSYEACSSEVSSPLRSVFDGVDSSITSTVQSPMYSATQLSPASTNCSSFAGPASLLSLLALDSYVYDHCDDIKMTFIPNLLDSLEHFGEDLHEEYDLNMLLTLPLIDPYLPKSEPLVSADVAATLFSLYKSHCTSVFESLRYMKLKTLTKSLHSFQRPLTNPVFKLYTSESIIPWIQKCDILLYQFLLKMLSKLILQPVPDHVLKQLQHISRCYPTLLAESLQYLPKKLCYMKLSCAQRFSSLMAKIVDICQFSSKANQLLTNEETATDLHLSWTHHVDVNDLVLQSLPVSKQNVHTFQNIFSTEIPQLFNTQQENIVSKWLNYFSSLPARFSDIPHWVFPLLFNTMFDAALKKVFFQGSEQLFLNWWTLKNWINEWFVWYGEVGGFLSLFNDEPKTKPLMNQPFSNPIHRVFDHEPVNNLNDSLNTVLGDVSDAHLTTVNIDKTNELHQNDSLHSDFNLPDNIDKKVKGPGHDKNYSVDLLGGYFGAVDENELLSVLL